MGFWDELLGRSGSALGGIGNGLNLAADIAGAKEDKKTAGYLGMAGGGSGFVSSLLSGGKGIMDLLGANKDMDENRGKNDAESIEKYKRAETAKKGSIAGLIGSGAGIVSGIADFIGGFQKKDGGEGTAAGWASNIAGLIGSGAGIAQGVFDWRNADTGLKKASAVNGLVGNIAGGIGGLAGLVGNFLNLSKNKKTKGIGDKFSLAGSWIGNGIGSLTGLLGTILG